MKRKEEWSAGSWIWNRKDEKKEDKREKFE